MYNEYNNRNIGVIMKKFIKRNYYENQIENQINKIRNNTLIHFYKIEKYL